MESSNKPEDPKEETFVEKVLDVVKDVEEKLEEAIGKPTADVAGIHFPIITLEKAEIVVDLLVSNPSPFPIPLVDMSYLIDSAGRKLVSGLIPDAGTIHPHSSQTIKIPLVLVYEDIKKTYEDIKPGSVVPYRVKVDLIIDVPIFGRFTIPVEKTGEIPIPHKPDIDIEKVHFGKFSLEETTADLHLKLHNKNEFNLGLNALNYEFCLAEESIANAQLEKSTNIEKNEIAKMEIPISFRPKDFGSALWDVLSGRGTGYSMKGNIDVDTPFGHMNLPISKEGGTTRLKKAHEKDDDDQD